MTLHCYSRSESSRVDQPGSSVSGRERHATPHHPGLPVPHQQKRDGRDGAQVVSQQ